MVRAQMSFDIVQSSHIFENVVLEDGMELVLEAC